MSIIENIIPIKQYPMGKGYKKEETSTVNARDLWKALEVGRDFSNWIKDRIEKYGFEKNVDYAVVNSLQNTWKIPKNFDSPNLANHHLVNETQLQNPKLGGDKRSIEYILTLDTAKEISMIENNKIGREIRKYFIECEKEFKKTYVSLESLKGLFEFMGTDNRIGGSLLWSISDTVSNKEVEGFKELVIPRDGGSFIFYQTAREKEILENTTTHQQEFQKVISDKQKLERDLEIARAEIEVYKAKERLYELKLKGRKDEII